MNREDALGEIEYSDDEWQALKRALQGIFKGESDGIGFIPVVLDNDELRYAVAIVMVGAGNGPMVDLIENTVKAICAASGDDFGGATTDRLITFLRTIRRHPRALDLIPPAGDA